MRSLLMRSGRFKCDEGIVKEFIIPHYERPNNQPLYENEHRNDHTHVEDDDESKEAPLSRSEGNQSRSPSRADAVVQS